MDQEFLQILDMTGAAAAGVRDGAVSWCTAAARRMGLLPGMELRALLPDSIPPEGGTMQFPVPALGEGVIAGLSTLGGQTVLLLRSEDAALTVNALGQISRVLNGPIEDILFNGRNLFERLEALEDPAIQAGTARLTRNFYRLLRTSGALLDQYGSTHDETFAPERTDLRRWLRDMTDRLCSVVDSTGRQLDVKLPENRLYAPADPALLEQALLGLLSNAIRFSPSGSAVTLRLYENAEHCFLNLRNAISAPVSFPDLGGAFTRTLGSEDQGLGLGLRRVQQIARLHGGTLLLECTPEGCFSATVCIPCRRDGVKLRAPAVPVDRSGGYDRMLVELADVLPDEVFDSRNL